MLTSSFPEARADLRKLLADNAYPGYVYGYPHKKAYRHLDPQPTLADVWSEEDLQHLYCYVHIPFCTQRCSFCNLFTVVPGNDSPVPAYLEALCQEMLAYRRSLGPMHFSRLYLGGGTPTYLSPAELSQLVGDLREHLGVDPAQSHGCIEASPETLDAESAETIRALGFQRVSLGIQSAQPGELTGVNRRFDIARHQQAVAHVERQRFPHFNVDLIYGLPGQTLTTWAESLAWAADTGATSLFLYPLYIRPLTGLGVRQVSLDSPSPHAMGQMYDHAVTTLARRGWKQLSMRQFRRDHEQTDDEYRCQRHGMVGLGAGARSYTTHLHYSTPWKMIGRNIRAVIDEYVQRQKQGAPTIEHGFWLDEDERLRRVVIQSLLFDGLNLTSELRERFAPEWELLDVEGLITGSDPVCLTARGVRHADIVGQLFFSPRVRDLIATYEYDT